MPPAVPSGGPGHGLRASAVLMAPDEETRVLLRGLLRLHHVRVVGEADDPGRAAELVEAHHPALLLADTGPMQTPIAELLRRSRSAVDGLRVVVVTTGARSLGGPGSAREADAVLVRPFRVRQFAEALGELPSP